jgi:hypothetical protein
MALRDTRCVYTGSLEQLPDQMGSLAAEAWLEVAAVEASGLRCAPGVSVLCEHWITGNRLHERSRRSSSSDRTGVDLVTSAFPLNCLRNLARNCQRQGVRLRPPERVERPTVDTTPYDRAITAAAFLRQQRCRRAGLRIRCGSTTTARRP